MSEHVESPTRDYPTPEDETQDGRPDSQRKTGDQLVTDGGPVTTGGNTVDEALGGADT